MNIIIFFIAFVLAIDEFALTQTLHRPLIASTIVGALFGDVQTGLLIGAYLELASLSFEETFFLNFRKSLVLASVLCTALSATKTLSSEETMALAVSIIIVGTALSHIIDFVVTLLLPLSRNQAEKGKSVFVYQLIALLIRGVAFGVCASYLFSKGTEIPALLSSITTTNGWIFNAFAIIGVLLPSLGIAVLMRNLSVKDNYGIFFAGVSVAMLAYYVSKNFYVTILLVALLAIGLGYYDFNRAEKETVKTTNKGGGEKWW